MFFFEVSGLVVYFDFVCSLAEDSTSFGICMKFTLFEVGGF